MSGTSNQLGTGMTVERWLAAALADAEARGLSELQPLLRGLAGATVVLRAGQWNERADADTDEAAPTRAPERHA